MRMPQQDDEVLREEVLRSNITYQGSFLKICRQQVRLPDGRIAEREMVRHGGAAAIIPLFDDGTTILERQWRASAGGAFWEVPAGKIDPGEEPDITAQRELTEECGLRAQRWTCLGVMCPTIGYSNERIWIYAARTLTPAHQHLDPNEFLCLHRLPLQEVFSMAIDGEISDGKTLTALFWLQKHLQGALVGRSFAAANPLTL